ncbi:hypothetical protein QCA50_016061 [Cerrena zonata]|uniref:Uncharacterized protein n=1 Tax=Cerrena zonata TaxID=2478898 RepID=A0AAW0FG98_9APHY
MFCFLIFVNSIAIFVYISPFVIVSTILLRFDQGSQQSDLDGLEDDFEKLEFGISGLGLQVSSIEPEDLLSTEVDS